MSEKIKTLSNQWCPRDGMPECMYLEVPTGEVDEDLLERHFVHWVTTRDWDNEKQKGFWLYTAYTRALPENYYYLALRIMNLVLVFQDQESYQRELKNTLRAILFCSPADFDWEPYLQRKKGETAL